MIKTFLYLILGLILIWSCNSSNDDTSGNADSTIIEVISSDNQSNSSIDEDKNDSGQNPTPVDSKFAEFLAKFGKVSLPYKIVPENKLDYEKIPFELQATYLSKAEGLDRSELDQMQDYAKFYYLSHPVSADKFNAIVYARSEMGSSYYILCTYNNQGQLISFIDFAMYQLIGAGPQAGQEFTMTGSIDKNLVVTTVSDQATKNYQIDDDGKIVKK